MFPTREGRQYQAPELALLRNTSPNMRPAAVIAQAIDADSESRLDAAQWEQRDREIERARTLLRRR